MINQISQQNIKSLTTEPNQTPSQESLNQVLLINGVASLDSSIKDIAGNMKNELEQKRTLRSQISSINTILYQPKTQLEDGTAVYEVSEAQKAMLSNLSNGKMTYVTLNGKQYATAEALTSLKDTLNSEVQELNSGSEIRAIELQSLMDQRKNLMTMLSNMMASGTEILSAIIRNIK